MHKKTHDNYLPNVYSKCRIIPVISFFIPGMPGIFLSIYSHFLGHTLVIIQNDKKKIVTFQSSDLIKCINLIRVKEKEKKKKLSFSLLSKKSYISNSYRRNLVFLCFNKELIVIFSILSEKFLFFDFKKSSIQSQFSR